MSFWEPEELHTCLLHHLVQDLSGIILVPISIHQNIRMCHTIAHTSTPLRYSSTLSSLLHLQLLYLQKLLLKSSQCLSYITVSMLKLVQGQYWPRILPHPVNMNEFPQDPLLSCTTAVPGNNIHQTVLLTGSGGGRSRWYPGCSGRHNRWWKLPPRCRINGVRPGHTECGRPRSDLISPNTFFCSTRRFGVRYRTPRLTATWRATSNSSAALWTKSDVHIDLIEIRDGLTKLSSSYGLYLNHTWVTHSNDQRSLASNPTPPIMVRPRFCKQAGETIKWQMFWKTVCRGWL